MVLSFQRVLTHSEDQALLKAYISEWRKFFDQCSYLPKPFNKVEDSLNALQSNATVPKKNKSDDNDVRKVGVVVWDQLQ